MTGLGYPVKGGFLYGTLEAKVKNKTQILIFKIFQENGAQDGFFYKHFN